MDRLQEVANLQKEYYELFHGHNGKTCSKQAIVKLVVPFRNKYHLTDKEALDIARSVMPNWQIVNLLEVDENERDKMGRWKSAGRGMGFECSNCGFRTDFELNNFCPDCGAKMSKD